MCVTRIYQKIKPCNLACIQLAKNSAAVTCNCTHVFLHTYIYRIKLASTSPTEPGTKILNSKQ